MNAIVSGRSERALILDGESLSSFDLDDPSRIVPRRRSDLPYLFGDGTDLRVLEDTTLESVERELRLESHFTWALDLTLISLDSELEDDLRKEALEELEELFEENTIVTLVENVLYSEPLPDDADLKGALEASSDNDALSTVFGFLRKLENCQPSIDAVKDAWEAIPTKVFGNLENRNTFKHATIKEGLFRDLVTLDPSAFLLKAGLKKSVQKLPNHRQVLQTWIAPFRQSRENRNIVREEQEDLVLASETFERRRRIDRRAVLREAQKRKSVIVAAMQRRDLARVEDLIDELVAYQQSNSESQHTAKSLCDLGMEAKALGMRSLQLTLTERSIAVAPGDGWSWAQYGGALLEVSRLDEALTAFAQAEAFGAGTVARTGRAEVFKIQGQFAKALAAYEEVIDQHPENAVAKRGRAEVLKAQGHLDKALAAYNEVIDRYPEDPIAKSGRAEVLKAKGQLDNALAAYEEVIAQYPEDLVAKNGRAEVLKAQGQFAKARAAYDEVISQSPEDKFAKCGRAEILKAQGQFAEALAAYDEVIVQYPEDVVAKCGRAEILKVQGQFAKALGAYNEVISQYPKNPVAKRGRAEVLKAQGQFAKALAAYEEVISLYPDDPIAKSGRAEVFKAQGQFAKALAAYDEAISQHPYNHVARNGRSSVLVALERYEEALESFPQTTLVDLQDWIASHIRGMCLLRLGENVNALRLFNEGVQNCPFSSQKEYFRSALALTWLRTRDFKKAGESLDAVTSPLLQPVANVIRIHAFGADGNRHRALQAYENLKAAPHILTDELTQELHHQYVLQENPTKDEEWIFDREVRMFLRAA